MFQALTVNSTGTAKTGNTNSNTAETLVSEGVRLSVKEYEMMSGSESVMSREKGGDQVNSRKLSFTATISVAGASSNPALQVVHDLCLHSL